MTAVNEQQTVITPPEIETGGVTVTREIDGIGTLKFENYGPGQWLTQKGTVAKKSRRRYLLDDEELESVSQIVGVLDKPALVNWAEKHGAIGAVQAYELGELAGVHPDDYVARIRSLNLGASAKRDEGADRGKAIHTAFHRLAVDGRVPNPMEFDGVARPWVQGAMRAWLTLDPGDVILAEQPVCHPGLRYAGTPDLVAVIDGQVTLLDYKTGKGRIYEQAHWQARLYEMALAECGIEVEAIKLIGIADDGTFEVIDCAVSREDAEHLLAVRRAGLRVARGMASQRKAAKA